MNIVMMTNTYAPHVGGVARSVDSFARAYRTQGHRVLIVAPEFEHMQPDEVDVVRVAAIQHFNGSDFSVVLPVVTALAEALDEFEPDIVHSHHPFLIGMTALRVAHARKLPLVYTNHTMYERYTHYVPGDSPTMKRFVIELTVRYANMVDHVFAPSESLINILRQRGVTKPITELPTGVELTTFAHGSGSGFKAAMNIPTAAFVVGHVGRLAPEKNLAFLINAVIRFLASSPSAHFLLVGDGPLRQTITREFRNNGLRDRLHLAGTLDQPLLSSAYQAMDVFAFASTSETQGMVLTEAMAAGVPVVAVDAPGVREVVHDKINGRLLPRESVDTFVDALVWTATLDRNRRTEIRRAALETAESFSMPKLAARATSVYESLRHAPDPTRDADFAHFSHLLRLIEAEVDILVGFAGAAGAAFSGGDA